MPDKIERDERSESTDLGETGSAVVKAALLGGLLGSRNWKNDLQKLSANVSEALPAVTLGDKSKSEYPQAAATEKVENAELKFDFGGRRKDVIVSITLPDGGKVSRVTEALPGRDKEFFVLKGFRLPDGTVVEKDIHRNTDGTVSVLDKNVDNRNPDRRHERRMTPAQFIDWVKLNQRK